MAYRHHVVECDFCHRVIPTEYCNKGYCPYCGSLIQSRFDKKALKEGYIVVSTIFIVLIIICIILSIK